MGNKKQPSITLNGKRYDAHTGQLVDASNTTGPIMDVVAPRGAHKTQLAVPTPPPSAAPEPPVGNPVGPKVMDVSRSTVRDAAHLKPRQPQRANTLVRSAVSRPRPGLKSQTKVITPTQSVSVPQTAVTPKWSLSQVNPTRQNRAATVQKSQSISKFSPSTTSGALEPSAQALAAVKVQQPAEAVSHTTQPHDLFERAIAAADSHTQTYVDAKTVSKQARKQARTVTKRAKKPVHHHLASVVAASFAVLVIGGIIGLQNKNAITLRFANAQAGFQASLPTYQPDGYGVGSFTYSAGNVGTTFHDAASNRDYTLTQQTTKWDSQTLLDNYVRANYPSYQTLQSGNQVIYVYGKNDASWIKNGIWYQLTSNGSLSTSQVLNIAASV